MSMHRRQSTGQNHRRGSVLVLVVVSMTALFLLGVGLMSAAYGVRHRSIKLKNEAAAMLAAEAGYEQAIFWMSQQQDMLSTLLQGKPGTTGSLSLPDSTCSYEIKLHTFAGSRPIYRIVSTGTCGMFGRTVDVTVMQMISGWDMGSCRAPSGGNKTGAVNFANGEIIDMPIHINDLGDNPDYRDIYITGSPTFLKPVSMGESRHTAGGFDKYDSVMDCFDGGISFDQPDAKITDRSSVEAKIDRFRDSTRSTFKFKPTATAGNKIKNPNAAVQLEFFVSGGVGKVRITNHCTVRGYQQEGEMKTWDYMIKEDPASHNYIRYDIYGYHVKDESVDSVTRNISDSYVTQKIGGIESVPGGQIFVDGNVIIGGDDTSHDNGQVINGKITVVATGNIWIADNIQVDGSREADGMPASDNPNVLGLIAQGVVKVVDPGMSEYSYVDGTPDEPTGYEYAPIGVPDPESGGGGGWGGWGKGGKGGGGSGSDEHKRHLPNPMVVEAAITCGAGGWGAENVAREWGWKLYGGRKEAPNTGKQNDLILRGTITEALRGVVGLIGVDGFLKKYYMDERFFEGALPGHVWLSGKFIPTPAGWHDYRPGT